MVVPEISRSEAWREKAVIYVLDNLWVWLSYYSGVAVNGQVAGKFRFECFHIL
jgi:hypothetical protein